MGFLTTSRSIATPTRVTPAAPSTHWPLSPTPPRLSPSLHYQNHAWITPPLGMALPPKLWPPTVPLQTLTLVPAQHLTVPPALCLLFTPWGPPSIDLPPLPPSTFSLDTKVHHLTTPTNIPNSLASFLFHAPAGHAPSSEPIQLSTFSKAALGQVEKSHLPRQAGTL